MRLIELRPLIDPDRRIRIVCEGNEIFEGLAKEGLIAFERYIVCELAPVYDVINQRVPFKIRVGQPPKIGRPRKK